MGTLVVIRDGTVINTVGVTENTKADTMAYYESLGYIVIEGEASPGDGYAGGVFIPNTSCLGVIGGAGNE